MSAEIPAPIKLSQMLYAQRIDELKTSIAKDEEEYKCVLAGMQTWSKAGATLICRSPGFSCFRKQGAETPDPGSAIGRAGPPAGRDHCVGAATGPGAARGGSERGG